MGSPDRTSCLRRSPARDSAYDEELSRLLVLYRRGHITEEVLLAQMRDLAETEAGVGELGQKGERRTHDLGPSTPRRIPFATDPTILEILDIFRAAEASGAETLRAWAELSDDAALVGGLRTIAAREELHAALLAERLRDLGGRPTAVIPDWLIAYNAAIADSRASDLDRLTALVAQFPDVQIAIAPLMRVIDKVDDDPLTCEILRTMCDDEIASLKWIHAAYARCSEEREG